MGYARKAAKEPATALDSRTILETNRILDQFLVSCCDLVNRAQREIRSARGERLAIFDFEHLDAMPAATVSSSAARAVRSPGTKRRVEIPPLPDGYVMPGMPTMFTHPSQRAAFQKGVSAAFVPGGASCPYGDAGLGAVCGRAWHTGLRQGEAMRSKGPPA